MRICFCVKGIGASGGGERIVTIVASGLAARGHDVSLLSFDAPATPSFFALHPAIKRIDLGIGSTTEQAKLGDTVRRIAALRRTLRRESPDVVVGFMNSMYIPVGLALIGTSIPLIASEHIVWAHYRTRPLQAALLFGTPLLCDRITCVSEQARRTYPMLRDKMSVIENPVIPADGRANVLGTPGSRRKILAIGRFDRQKDHRTLLAAFAAIAAEMPDWDLHIVGDGPLADSIRDQIAAAGLDGRVQIRAAAKDVSREYSSAQLFVTSSRYESYGLTLAEALTHGLPAVGFSDCTGTNLQIRSGVDGLLVDGSGDRAGHLARGLRSLMQDDASRARMADAARTVVRKPISATIDEWETLIEDLARPSAPSPGR